MEKRQILPFETGLGIRNVAFTLSLSSLSQMATSKWMFNLSFEMAIKSGFTFLFFFLLIIKKEGIRFPTLFGIIVELFLQFYKYDQELKLKIIYETPMDGVFMVICFALVAIQFTLMYLNPIFYPIPPTGSLQVGYTIKQIDDVKFGIFYPTDEKYNPKRDIPYFSDTDKFLDQLAFFTYRYPREFQVQHIPAFMLKLSLGPLMKRQRMEVIYNAKLKKLTTKYPIMIYSHGYNTHMNLQASLCKDLASKGVMVIVPDHHDEVYISKVQQYPVPLDKFIEVMNEGAIKRKNDIQKIITYVLDPSKKVIDFFTNGEELKNSFEVRKEIIMCGHSFGGLSAMITSLDDSRIYTTIILDPVMSIFDTDPYYQKLLKKSQDKPFLILCSENFHKRFPYFSQREQIESFTKAQNHNKNSILAGQLLDTGHGNFSDFAYYIPLELAIFRDDILKTKEVTTHHLIINKLVEYFILESQTDNTEFKNIKMDNVLNQFEELTKNILEIKKEVFYKFEI